MQHGATVDNNPVLMRNFNEGKDKALKEVYEYFKKDLFYFAKKLLNNDKEGEEVMHDSFLKLFTMCSDFKTFSNIRSFLYQVTRNACIDLIRKKKAATNRLGVVVSLPGDDEAYDLPESPSDEPFWATIQTELVKKIKAQVETLPPDCRRIFKMRYYDDKTVTDIAKELGITKATVSGQITIAKGKLRRSIIPLTLVLYIRTILHYFIK